VCIAAFIGLMLRPHIDSGIRIWLLNHTPDQVVIISPFDGKVERKFQVADGLRGLAFSRDGTKAYFYNVVDVSNRLTVKDTRTYLTEEVIEVDGVPQGIGVFPDNRKLAVILGSKTDFMAGGFDVIDLMQQSKADPRKKKRLYRERDLSLTHKIAISDDGDKIYCVDAKSDKIHVFSFSQQQQFGAIDLHGAPEELLYPRIGSYYYVSVLQHRAIYQINKFTDTVEAAYIYAFFDRTKRWAGGKLRHMAIDSSGRYLVGTNYEESTVAIWDLKSRDKNDVRWQDVPYYPDVFESAYRFECTHYLPLQRFKLKGGYDPNYTFTPGGQHVEIDPLDEYLVVVDDTGAVYVYDWREGLRTNWRSTGTPETADGVPIPEPREIVVDIADRTTEIRDLKISQAAVRGAAKE
jgi:DNA-binding beta-propeller fold protein YncE